MVKPISPSEIDKTKVIPEQVIEAFNELIQKNYLEGSSTVKLKEALDLVCEKMNITEANLDSRWFDVEDVYKKSGWSVKYESPCRDESFPPFFTFTEKRKRK